MVGDLNCKNKKWGCNSTNTNGKHLYKGLYDIGLENIDVPLNYVHFRNKVTKLDRIQQIMNSIIRNFSITNVESLETIGSDHLPMLFEIQPFDNLIRDKKGIKLYHKLNMSSAEIIISNLNSFPSSSTEDIEKKTKNFQKALSDIDKLIQTHEFKNTFGINLRTRKLIKKEEN